MQEQTSISRVRSQKADVGATLDFLDLILPPEGDHWYVAAIFIGKKVSHFWHRTRLALASCLLEHDEQGAAAYHACATYRARGGGRKGDNVAAVRSLWCDIDAGPGKQYETANQAHSALVDLCHASELPRPLCVGSGYGVHAYWPLLNPLDPETWKTYSAGLAALLRKHRINHDRTTDIASILRPPGTHNRKREPRIVGVL
jgi:hypothetical protein